MISIRTFILTVVAAIILMVAIYFYSRHRHNADLDAAKKDFGKEKELAGKKADSIIQDRDKNINQLIETNERAKQESEYWHREALRRSINPNYDFDFITAAGIISNSHYKAGE